MALLTLEQELMDFDVSLRKRAVDTPLSSGNESRFYLTVDLLTQIILVTHLIDEA